MTGVQTCALPIWNAAGGEASDGEGEGSEKMDWDGEVDWDEALRDRLR